MFERLKSALVAFVARDLSFRRVLANSGWLLGSGALAKGLSVVQMIVAARVLGPEHYGILTLVLAYTLTVNQFVDSRVWEAAIRFVTGFRVREEHAKAAALLKLCYLVDAVTAVVVFGLLALSAEFAARLLIKDPAGADLIRLYALSVLIAIPNGTATALLRVADRFRILALQQAAAAGIRLAGVVAVAVLGGGVRGILWVYLFAAAVGTVLLLSVSLRSARTLGLPRLREAPLRLLRGEYRAIFRFTFYSNLGATSRIITSRADTLVLGWLSVPAEVGLYRLARSVADPLMVLLDPIYAAVYPELSKLAEKGRVREIRGLQRKLSFTMAMLGLPAALLLTVAAGLIPVVLGSAYAGAVPLAQILVWQVVWVPLIWFPGYLLATGRERMLAGVNWTDALLYLGLLVALVGPLGGLGASVATLLRFVLWTLLACGVLLYIHRKATMDGVRT